MKPNELPEELEEDLRLCATVLEQRASGFDFTAVLDVYERDYAVPRAFALSQLRELKRYLIVRRLSPGMSLGMKGPVDHLWHCFILCTQQYFSFCRLLETEYLHHDPCFVGGGGTASYAAFLLRYQQLFGEVPPAEHWPEVGLAPVRMTQQSSSIRAALDIN